MIVKVAIQRLFLVGLGFVLALAVAEGAMYAVDLAPLQDLKKRPWIDTSHELYGWFHIPNSEFEHTTRFVDFGVRVKINSKGLRDREYPYEKGAQSFRVLALGDSGVASLEVPLDDAWHEVLERLMNEPSRTGKMVEVVGAGVQGWATDQELLYFTNEGHKYQPNLVLLMFFMNDIWGNYPDFLEPEVKREKPYFILEASQLKLQNFPYEGEGIWVEPGSQSTRIGRIGKILARNLRTYRFVRRVEHRRKKLTHPFCYSYTGTPLPGIPTELFVLFAQSYSSPRYTDAWKLTMELIRELRRQVENRGARFAVFLSPDRRQILPEAWQETLRCWPEAAKRIWNLDKPGQLLGDFLRHEGIPFFDLTAYLREHFARTGRSPFFDQDWHFNREGHRVTANLLHDWLGSTHLVPMRSGPP